MLDQLCENGSTNWVCAGHEYCVLSAVVSQFERWGMRTGLQVLDASVWVSPGLPFRFRVRS